MNNEQKIARHLEQLPVPSLKESSHRSLLKSQLLRQKQPSPEVRPSDRNGLSRPIRIHKVAATVVIAASLVAAGWTAEKVYQEITGKYEYVELEKSEPAQMKLPDRPSGPDSMTTVSSMGTTIPPEAPPGTRERAKRHHDQMQQLISKKQYKLIKTIENPLGLKQYLYQFTFADGEQTTLNFTMLLDNVTSWDDYLQKRKQQQESRDNQISAAIAAGRFRLLDVEPITIHVCKDADSNEKLLVQRIDLHDGQEIASVRLETSTTPKYQTSWPDHLKSIRRGKRMLLKLEVVKNYTYEITLDDGSTTLFTYGGDGALEAPQR